jgi:hypothetical protein
MLHSTEDVAALKAVMIMKALVETAEIEVNQYPVAHVLRDEPAEVLHGLGDTQGLPVGPQGPCVPTAPLSPPSR